MVVFCSTSSGIFEQFFGGVHVLKEAEECFVIRVYASGVLETKNENAHWCGEIRF
jgi:hypothetical protein